MRTTLNLPDDLVAEARAVALREGTTLTALLTDGLRARLRSSGSTASGRPLPTSEVGGGLQPWVDPSSNASLLDAADRDGDARP